MLMNMKADRIGVLDGLRGYAVLCVFTVHFAALHYRQDYFTSNDALYYLIVFFRSHLGVDLFFAISGFLMCLIYFSKDISFRKFYSLRLLRLAPAYIAAVLLYYVHRYFDELWGWVLMLLICGGAYVFSKTSLISLFKHFPFVQVFGVILLIGFGYAGLNHTSLYALLANLLFMQYFFHVHVLMHVSWSLVTELLFYILFFLLKRVSHRVSMNVIYLLSITILMAFAFQFIFSQYFDVKGLNLHRYMSFATGLLLGFIVTKKVDMPFGLPNHSTNMIGAAILIALILLQQGWLPLLNHFVYPASRWIYYLGAAIVFFFLIREAIAGNGVIGYLFRNRFFIAVGKVSYSFYLLHVLIIGILYKILLPIDGNGMFLHFLLSLIVTYLMSYFFYETLEKPYFSKRQMLRE